MDLGSKVEQNHFDKLYMNLMGVDDLPVLARKCNAA